jgi:hypothetical protein
MRYRVDMPKEDIHVRVETGIAQDVRDYAATNGISLAAAVSILLRQALAQNGEQQP